MEFTIQRRDLAAATKIAVRAVKTESTLEVLKSICVEAMPDGRITFEGTDTEQHVITWAKGEVEEPGSICLDGRRLASVAESLKEAPVRVKLDFDNLQTTFACKGSTVRLAGIDPDAFLHGNEIEAVRSATVSEKGLALAIQQALVSVGGENVKAVCHAALFEWTPGGGIRIVSTDTHKMSLVDLDAPHDLMGGGCVVPEQALLELKGILDEKSEGEVEIHVGTNEVLFRAGKWEYRSRLVDMTYPLYMRVINKAGRDWGMVVDRDEVISALGRVRLIAETHHAFKSRAKVQVNAERGVLVFSAEGAAGHITEEVNVAHNGEPHTFHVNYQYLQQTFSAMKGDRVKMEMGLPDTAFILKPEEYDEWTRPRFLIMPLSTQD